LLPPPRPPKSGVSLTRGWAGRPWPVQLSEETTLRTPGPARVLLSTACDRQRVESFAERGGHHKRGALAAARRSGRLQTLHERHCGLPASRKRDRAHRTSHDQVRPASGLFLPYSRPFGQDERKGDVPRVGRTRSGVALCHALSSLAAPGATTASPGLCASRTARSSRQSPRCCSHRT